MTPETLRELSRPRTAVDRLRARTTSLAAAGMGVALMAAISIAALRSTASRGVLAPFLDQSGLRPGTVLAAVLLVLPFAALAGQALGVGRLAAERQATLLAVAGATSGDLRRIRRSAAGGAFVRGGLLAGPVYLVAWLVLGLALPRGWRLLPVPAPWLPLAWLALVPALALVGGCLGGRDAARFARNRGDVLGSQTPTTRLPHRHVTWVPALAGVAVLIATFGGFIRFSGSSAVLAAVLLVVVLLLLVSASALVTRRTASATIRGRDAAVALLASAQRRGNPRAAGAVAGVLFICGLSFGFEGSFAEEAVLSFAPHTSLRSALINASFYLGGAGLAGLVGFVGVFVALLALALSLTDHLLGARRSVAATAVLGVEARRLVAVQARVLSATALPATLAGTLIGGARSLLIVLGHASATETTAGLTSALATLVVVGALVALACRGVAQLLAGRVRAASALENVRTP